jgi:hypothetical protein
MESQDLWEVCECLKDVCCMVNSGDSFIQDRLKAVFDRLTIVQHRLEVERHV